MKNRTTKMMIWSSDDSASTYAGQTSSVRRRRESSNIAGLARRSAFGRRERSAAGGRRDRAAEHPQLVAQLVQQPLGGGAGLLVNAAHSDVQVAQVHAR